MKSAKSNKNVYTEQFKVNSVYDGEKGQINIDTNINGVPKKVHIDFTKNDLNKMNIEEKMKIDNMMNIDDRVNFNDLLTLNSVDSSLEKRLQNDFLFPFKTQSPLPLHNLNYYNPNTDFTETTTNNINYDIDNYVEKSNVEKSNVEKSNVEKSNVEKSNVGKNQKKRTKKIFTTQNKTKRKRK
jgi:hypothetical protein